MRIFQKLLKYLLISISIGYGIIFIFIAISRISYPYGLEGMEGTHLIEVHRILNNQPIYTAPSLEYVPMIYPPLYFYLAALISKIFGFGFFPLRLLSLVATAGCVILIIFFVFRENRNSFAAVISSGLFMATYDLSNSWFDLARIDMLFVFFLFLGIVILRYSKRQKGFIASGIVFTLCMLTKQTAIAFILPIFIYSFFSITFKNNLIMTGTFLISLITIYSVLNVTSDGWFAYYLFALPKNHNISLYSLLTFWLNDILRPIGIAFIINLFYLMYQPKKLVWNKDLFFFVLFISFLVGSWLARSNIGGAGNTLIPAYLLISILFGLGIDRMMSLIDLIIEKQRISLHAYIFCIIFFQLILLFYNPFSLIPTENHKSSADQIIKIIKESPGEVLIPSHNYLALISDKKPYFNTFAFYEFTGNYGGALLPHGNEILTQLDNALIQKQFDLIITDRTDQQFYSRNLELNYKESNFYELEEKNTLFSVFKELSNSSLTFYKCNQ